MLIAGPAQAYLIWRCWNVSPASCICVSILNSYQGPERSWLKAVSHVPALLPSITNQHEKLPLCVIFGVAFVSSIAVLVWSVIIETGLGPADEHPYPNTVCRRLAQIYLF